MAQLVHPWNCGCRYSVRYINDRFLPDKAIDLMDEAGAMVQLASFEHEGASLNVGEIFSCLAIY